MLTRTDLYYLNATSSIRSTDPLSKTHASYVRSTCLTSVIGAWQLNT
jgi:hypothetical protein